MRAESRKCCPFVSPSCRRYNDPPPLQILKRGPPAAGVKAFHLRQHKNRNLFTLFYCTYVYNYGHSCGPIYNHHDIRSGNFPLCWHKSARNHHSHPGIRQHLRREKIHEVKIIHFTSLYPLFLHSKNKKINLEPFCPLNGTLMMNLRVFKNGRTKKGASKNRKDPEKGAMQPLQNSFWFV